jgi:hypothetical protein
MFYRRKPAVWIGIILLSSMFLLGQDGQPEWGERTPVMNEVSLSDGGGTYDGSESSVRAVVGQPGVIGSGADAGDNVHVYAGAVYVQETRGE